LGISLFTSLPDVHIGDTISYSVNVFNTAFPACDAGNTNPAAAGAIRAFVVTPDGKTNSITLLRVFLAPGDSDFYTNVVSYVVRAQDILPDGTVRATATDQGEIWQNDTHSEGGGNQGVNTEVNLPCVLLTAQCTGSVGENGAITFTGTVTNCGNNTLVGVTVTNFNDSGFFTVLFPTNLAIGQVTSFSGSWIPANPCLPSTGILTVLATDQFTSTPRTVTNATTITCQNVLTPGITVSKLCPATPVAPGQLLTFSGSVTNIGNVTLTNIVVINNQPVANTVVFTLPSLAPGASAAFTSSYLAPTNCSVTDTLIASAQSRCGTTVTNTATATCQIATTPMLVLTQICPAAPVSPGGLLTYSGSISNAGNIMLTNVVIVNNQSGTSPIFTATNLAPTQVATFTGSYLAPTNCSTTSTSTATGGSVCGVAVTTTVTSTCAIATMPALVLTQNCPVAPVSPGGLLTYSGTVSNAGNIMLTNVIVVNNQSGVTPIFAAATLAPYAVATFTGSYLAPTNCTSTSTSTAIAQSICGVPVTNAVSATCPVLTAPAIVVTQLCPPSSPFPGGLLTYSGTVSNAGNITLTNVVVLNNLSGATPIFTSPSLLPGAQAAFTGSYVAPTNCSSTSTATATGQSICGVAVTGKASTTCVILTPALISLTAVCPATPVVPGGSVTYTGTVHNPGIITLTNVVVTSSRPGTNAVVFTAATLAPGASTNFTGTYTVPAGACTVTTTFTASGMDICALTPVTTSVATTCTVTTTPAVTVTLACPAVSAVSGGLITYSGAVSNAGNVILNNVFVVNNQPAPNTPVIGPLTLAPGAAAVFTTAFTAPLDSCSVSSRVTAVGSDNCTALLVTNTASATCLLITAPSLVLTQVCPLSPAVPGGLFTYSGSVSNSGNITITNLVVVNNLSGSTPIFTLPSLEPGVVTNFTGSYLVPTNCSTTSTSTVTGESVCGVAVTNMATATCAILTAPAIVVTEACPPTPVFQGGVMTYSGSVSNAGNIILTNIVVVSHWPGSNVVVTLPSLAPGASTNFTGSYVVPANCCVVWVTLEATGQDCHGTTVSDIDSGTCTVFTAPGILVTKVCGPGILSPGQLMTYSGIVSNTGNITLVNVTVANTQPSAGSLLLGPIDLAPGEFQTYTASYIVPVDFCGNDTVTATGLDVCGYLPVTSTATAACAVAPYSPRISVVNRCPTLPTPHGGLLMFSGTVSNLGNVTLVNVMVVNDQPSNNTPVIGPITLAPGAFYNFTGSYTVPCPSCCETIDTLTATGQDRCSGSNVTATSTAVCPMLYTPGIALLQICPPNPIPMGSLYVFSGMVTNTGDAILTNVVVASTQGGQTMSWLGPLDLAPGQAEPYAGSLTVSNTCAVTITATSQEVCKGTWVTNATACPVATTALIALTQTCPTQPVVQGGLLTYSGTVSNAGNITLTNVVVLNTQSGTTPVFTTPALPPGAIASFTGSYLTPTNTTTTSTSTVTGESICGNGVTNTVSATCPLLSGPLVVITVIGATNGSFVVSFPSIKGKTYTEEFKTDPSAPSWTDLTTVVGTGGTVTITNAVSAAQSKQIYRIRYAP